MAPPLPPRQTPLNQHSLMSLEAWLHQLGSEQNEEDRCCWTLVMPEWTAEIQINQSELLVVWEKKGRKTKCTFSYALSREDVEAAMVQGP